MMCDFCCNFVIVLSAIKRKDGIDGFKYSFKGKSQPEIGASKEETLNRIFLIEVLFIQPTFLCSTSEGKFFKVNKV
jgi:hypothetical protein